jgi:hypothetical protein
MAMCVNVIYVTLWYSMFLLFLRPVYLLTLRAVYRASHMPASCRHHAYGSVQGAVMLCSIWVPSCPCTCLMYAVQTHMCLLWHGVVPVRVKALSGTWRMIGNCATDAHLGSMCSALHGMDVHVGVTVFEIADLCEPEQTRQQLAGRWGSNGEILAQSWPPGLTKVIWQEALHRHTHQPVHQQCWCMTRSTLATREALLRLGVPAMPMDSQLCT